MKKFKAKPTGLFHIYIVVLPAEEGKLNLFAAIDRGSADSFARFLEQADTSDRD
jgi:hypothetical protein